MCSMLFRDIALVGADVAVTHGPWCLRDPKTPLPHRKKPVLQLVHGNPITNFVLETGSYKLPLCCYPGLYQVSFNKDPTLTDSNEIMSIVFSLSINVCKLLRSSKKAIKCTINNKEQRRGQGGGCSCIFSLFLCACYERGGGEAAAVSSKQSSDITPQRSHLLSEMSLQENRFSWGDIRFIPMVHLRKSWSLDNISQS